MIYGTESPLIGYTRIQRRLQSGGIPYNFPRSIRIVCRRILKNERIIAVLEVHTQPPYSDHGQPDITNEEDGIYTGASTDGLIQSNTGEHLMLNMTRDDQEEGQGYLGTFNVVVNANQTG